MFRCRWPSLSFHHCLFVPNTADSGTLTTILHTITVRITEERGGRVIDEQSA